MKARWSLRAICARLLNAGDGTPGGRPGYISDPVIDTSKNQIIYAHCVAPSKVYGPNGKSNPYHIRDHSEDRKGAAVRSLLPVGEIVTSIETNPVTQEIVIHTARTVANIDEDKACRTKIAAEVKDIDKLLGEWDAGAWHRVTFYGDYRRQVGGLRRSRRFPHSRGRLGFRKGGSQ
jgi:hypothetical protein